TTLPSSNVSHWQPGRGWKIEDRGSPSSKKHKPRMEDRNSILHPRSSILMVFMRVATTVLAMAKNQRLDHHRYRLGVGQLLADVDEIKVPEIDAVDGNYSSAG